MQYLRKSINLILNNKDYTGDEDFNPYTLINEVENTDKLLNCWINIIMDGVKTRKIQRNEILLDKTINDILKLWEPLLEKKHIYLKNIILPDNVSMNMSEIDMYLILNNFLLNSSWFLEETAGIRREINVKLEEKDKEIILYLENNGPKLDEKYKENPDRIFDAGETSKDKDNGTGLGLWITREAVIRNNGEIHTLDKQEGFGIKVVLPK